MIEAEGAELLLISSEADFLGGTPTHRTVSHASLQFNTTSQQLANYFERGLASLVGTRFHLTSPSFEAVLKLLNPFNSSNIPHLEKFTSKASTCGG